MKAFVLGLIVVFLKFRCGNKLHKTRTQGWYQIAFVVHSLVTIIFFDMAFA